jgi:hypothetical protein
VITTTLHVLQDLVSCGPGVGVALVPYYRQILPIFNLFKNRNGKKIVEETERWLIITVNLGDGIYYAQQKRENLGDLIEGERCNKTQRNSFNFLETLEKFERTGGDQAFVGIKYMVPTYESCMVRH